jgi:hypothetical protein
MLEFLFTGDSLGIVSTLEGVGRVLTEPADYRPPRKDDDDDDDEYRLTAIMRRLKRFDVIVLDDVFAGPTGFAYRKNGPLTWMQSARRGKCIVGVHLGGVDGIRAADQFGQCRMKAANLDVVVALDVSAANLLGQRALRVVHHRDQFVRAVEDRCHNRPLDRGGRIYASDGNVAVVRG